MEKKAISVILSVILLIGGTAIISTTTFVSYAKLNCSENRCTGGQGGQGGGAGGNFAFEDNTFTQSGGGGSSSLPGGGGGHSERNFDTGEFS